MKKLLLLYILIVLLCLFGVASPAFGADIYINPNWGGPYNGTFAEPYDDWDDFTISAGNDYRQLCGTLWDTGTGREITAVGTSENYILIGAYYDNAGSPAHEDDNPSFGQNCGNTDPKPILAASAKLSGDAIKLSGSYASNYIEFNSISAQKGYAAIRLYHTNNNIVRYCYLYDAFWGVNVAYSNYNLVEHNEIDLNHIGVDEVEPANTNDCVGIRGLSNTVQYNSCTGYDHIGVTVSGGLEVSKNNLITNNHIYKTTNTEDACVEASSSSYNTFSYNFCDDVGVMLQIGGQYNKAIYNFGFVDLEHTPESDYDGFSLFTVASCCHSTCTGYAAASNNTISNNTVVQGNSGNAVNNPGFIIWEGTDETLCDEGDINENNIIANNIIYKAKADERCMIVAAGLNMEYMIGINYFYNNQCYGFEAGRYSSILSTNYATADAFNVRNDAADNQEGDPKLGDPSTNDYTLDSDSPCIAEGYTTIYDDGLSPDTSLPPDQVDTVKQGTNFEIGAYSVDGATDIHYVTSEGALGKTGADMANAFSWADVFTAGNWDTDVANDNKIGPGDLVCLSGTITPDATERILQGNGTSENYIVFDGSGTGDCVNAADAATLSRATAGSYIGYINHHGADYIEYRDITFAGSMHTQLRIDESGANHPDYVRVIDCTFTGGADTRYNIVARQGSYIAIHGNTITNINNDYNDGVMLKGTQYAYVYNNSFKDCSHTAIAVSSYDGSEPVNYVYLYNNYIEMDSLGYGRAFGIIKEATGSPPAVNNVHIYQNWVNNMRTRSQIADVSDIYVYNNIFSNQQGCVWSEQGGDDACDEVGETGRHGEAWSVVSQVYGGTMNNIRFYNNTFYKSAEVAIFFYASLADLTNIYVDNNIFYKTYNAHVDTGAGEDYEGSIGIKNLSGKSVSFASFDNNIILQNAGTNNTEVTTRDYPSSYVYFKVENENDWNDETNISGNLNDNPDLTDPDNDIFMLQPVSPCINAALDVGDTYKNGWDPATELPPNTVDTFNRDVFGWDIGAYIDETDAWTCDHSAYFSSEASGNPIGIDTPLALTDCSSGTVAENTCDDIADINAYIVLADTDDEICIYMDRSDTFDIVTNTGTSGTPGIKVESYDPIVHIMAYGDGDLPIIDGGVADDFSNVTMHDGDGCCSNMYNEQEELICTSTVETGPNIHSKAILFNKDYCSIEYIRIQNMYGSAIGLGRNPRYADNTRIQDCEIYNFGNYAIVVGTNNATRNALIQRNKIYKGQQHWRYFWRDIPEGGPSSYGGCRWGQAIGLNGTPGTGLQPLDNIVRYNKIYDIGGEAIANLCGDTEYNLIGDTASSAIHPAPQGGNPDCTNNTRYNLVIMSGDDTYGDNIGGGSGHTGIDLHNEDDMAYPENVDVNIYGNVVINRRRGLIINDGEGWGHPWGNVHIYNNTIINSSRGNISFSSPDVFPNIWFYNNTSIFYGESDSTYHVYNATGDYSAFEIDKNLYYSDEGSHAIATPFRTGQLTGDPKLYGENTRYPSVVWENLNNGDPACNDEVTSKCVEWKDIAYITESALIGSGYNITSNHPTWVDLFLTDDTDFDTLPITPTFFLGKQTDAWNIGAYTGGFNIHTPIPSATKPCNPDPGDNVTPIPVTLGITSSELATCRYDIASSFKLTDRNNPCSTATYLGLAIPFSDTGNQTVHTDANVTQACNGGSEYSVMCQDDITEEISNCVTIIVEVAACCGEGSSALLNIETKGKVNIVTGGKVDIN